MTDISNRYAKCHPDEYCFEECTKGCSTREWHLYDMVLNAPVESNSIAKSDISGTKQTKKEKRKMKKNTVPAICERNNEWRGNIETEEIYEQMKKGEVDFKENLKPNMTHVILPYAVFMRLMKMDRVVDALNNVPHATSEEVSENG